MAAIFAGSANRLRDPRRIAGEQLVVLGRAQEAHHAQLHDELVDQLLRAGLVEDARAQIAVEVDIEEGRRAAQAHGRAVLLFHGAKVAEVQPLHRFPGGPGRSGDVAAIARRHRLEVFQRPVLLGDLLREADRLVAHLAVSKRRVLGLLVGKEPLDAVERDAAIVADDPPAIVGIRQTGDDSGLPRLAHLGRVAVEDAVIVGLPEPADAEDPFDLLRELEVVRMECAFDHADTAKGENGALERRVRLEADDEFEVAVDVTWFVRGDRRDDFGVGAEDPASALLGHELGDLLPEPKRAGRRRCEEAVVAIVGLVVELDEVAHVDTVAPLAGGEAVPRGFERTGILTSAPDGSPYAVSPSEHTVRGACRRP